MRRRLHQVSVLLFFNASRPSSTTEGPSSTKIIQVVCSACGMRGLPVYVLAAPKADGAFIKGHIYIRCLQAIDVLRGDDGLSAVIHLFMLN